MALYVFGMHQESACIPCTSWAQLQCSTQTPTQMITWIQALKESGHHSERCVVFFFFISFVYADKLQSVCEKVALMPLHKRINPKCMHSSPQTCRTSAAHTEGLKVPQVVQSSLSHLVDMLSVAVPVQFVIQVNSQVSVVLHHLHVFSQDRNSIWLTPDPPEIHSHFLFTLNAHPYFMNALQCCVYNLAKTKLMTSDRIRSSAGKDVHCY